MKQKLSGKVKSLMKEIVLEAQKKKGSYAR